LQPFRVGWPSNVLPASCRINLILFDLANIYIARAATTFI